MSALPKNVIGDGMEYLFVYGTLKRKPNAESHELLSGAIWIGRARIQGELYQLDGYPGLLPDSTAKNWVYGEVYLLADSDEVFKRLDEYEECSLRDVRPHEYSRQKCRVILDLGRVIQAWVYLLNPGFARV